MFTPVNFGVLFLIGLPLFVISIPFYHCTVLLEEAFLEHKYGDSYREYMNKVPRYIGKGLTEVKATGGNLHRR